MELSYSCWVKNYFLKKNANNLDRVHSSPQLCAKISSLHLNTGGSIRMCYIQYPVYT